MKASRRNCDFVKDSSCTLATCCKALKKWPRLYASLSEGYDSSFQGIIITEYFQLKKCLANNIMTIKRKMNAHNSNQRWIWRKNQHSHIKSKNTQKIHSLYKSNSRDHFQVLTCTILESLAHKVLVPHIAYTDTFAQSICCRSLQICFTTSYTLQPLHTAAYSSWWVRLEGLQGGCLCG